MARRAAGPPAPDPLSRQPRAFVAVPLEEAARRTIVGIVDGVRRGEPEGRGVRWVRLDGLHITLRFLGPISEARVADLAGAAREVAAATAAFSIRLDGAGAFPSAGRPRAIWLGVADGADRLRDLATSLERALAAHGWPPAERPFRAHLTLARADGVRAGPATVEALAQAIDGAPIVSAIDRIVVFESITGAGPARYVPLAEAPLG